MRENSHNILQYPSFIFDMNSWIIKHKCREEFIKLGKSILKAMWRGKELCMLELLMNP